MLLWGRKKKKKCHWAASSASTAKPQWIQTMKDTALAIEERLYWECRANGKPKPSYSWLKNGQQLLSEVKKKKRKEIQPVLCHLPIFHFKDLICSCSSSFHFAVEPGVKRIALFFFFPSSKCNLDPRREQSVNISARCASDETRM